jgi:hypothetical protein
LQGIPFKHQDPLSLKLNKTGEAKKDAKKSFFTEPNEFKEK